MLLSTGPLLRQWPHMEKHSKRCWMGSLNNSQRIAEARSDVSFLRPSVGTQHPTTTDKQLALEWGDLEVIADGAPAKRPPHRHVRRPLSAPANPKRTEEGRSHRLLEGALTKNCSIYNGDLAVQRRPKPLPSPALRASFEDRISLGCRQGGEQVLAAWREQPRQAHPPGLNGSVLTIKCRRARSQLPASCGMCPTRSRQKRP